MNTTLPTKYASLPHLEPEVIANIHFKVGGLEGYRGFLIPLPSGPVLAWWDGPEDGLVPMSYAAFVNFEQTLEELPWRFEAVGKDDFRQVVYFKATSPYRKFREDGWPLCPCCGQDELYSPYVQRNGDTLLQLHTKKLETIERCYLCRWSPKQ